MQTWQFCVFVRTVFRCLQWYGSLQKTLEHCFWCKPLLCHIPSHMVVEVCISQGVCMHVDLANRPARKPSQPQLLVVMDK